jgi:hypothetical protein
VPVLKKYRCIDENSLHLNLIPNIADSHIVESLEVSYQDSTGNLKWYYTPPHYMIDLQTFNVFDETDIAVSMRYYTNKSNVAVRGLPLANVKVLLKAPVVNSVSLVLNADNKRELLFDVPTKADANLKAEILIDRQPVISANLDANKKLSLDSGALNSYAFNERSNMSVRLYYFNDNGCSRPSPAIPVVFEKPVIKLCRFKTDPVIPVLTLADNGFYNCKAGTSAAVLKQGPHIELAAGSSSVEIQKKINNFYGPKITYAVSSPGYYCFAGEHGVFCQYNDKPAVKPAADIKISLGNIVMPVYGSNESHFALTETGSEKFLTMKAAAFNAELKDLRADFIKLLNTCAKDYASLDLIRKTVRDKLPVPVQDMLFYYYGYDPNNGMTDLCAGMSLFAEYAIYQNVPQTRDTDFQYQANGYTGTSTARYQIITRNNCLTFEPFIRNMTDSAAFVIPKPEIPDSRSILSGGAGINDLLFENFNAVSFVKLVYPPTYKSRNCDEQDTRYYDNICLVGAADYAKLSVASETIRTVSKVSVDGIYTNFRGRASVVVQLQINIDNTRQWASLGTTLGDVMDMMGIQDIDRIEFLRNDYPVNTADRNMPVITGDSVNIKRV